MIVVLDSSAIIALLTGEPEGLVVDGLFSSAKDEGEGISIYAHSVNLCEVFYHILGNQSTDVAEEAIARIKEDGLTERNDTDGLFWRDVARLVALGRQLPKPEGGRGNLAFGDACGIALANRLGAQFVTKDRTETEPLDQTGLVNALFIL